MSDITNEINTINTAIYGKDVRAALSNGLLAINEQANEQTSNINDLQEKVTALDGTVKDGTVSLKDFVDKINQSNQSAKSLIEEMQTIVNKNNNSVCGGTNLCNNSFFNSSGTVFTESQFISDSAYLESGVSYVFTFAGNSNVQGQSISLNYGPPNNGTVISSSWNLTTSYSTYYSTFTPSVSGDYNLYFTTTQSNNSSITIYWYGIQIGTNGTSWTPNGIQLVNNVSDNSTNITSLQNNFNNILNVKYNYFENSNFGSTGITGCGYLVPNVPKNTTRVELIAGETYTFTGKACVGKEGYSSWIDLYSYNWDTNPNLLFNNTAPEINHITFTCKTTGFYYVQLYVAPQGSTSNIEGTFYWYTLVQGSTPSIWGVGNEISSLAVQNFALKEQNKQLGKQMVNLTLNNNNVQKQVNEVAKTIVQMQLNKNTPL